MPLNFLKPDSNSRSLSQPAAESSGESDPRTQPQFLPLLWGVLGIIIQARFCYQADAFLLSSGIIALISTLTLIFGGVALCRKKAEGTNTNRAIVLAGGIIGFLAGVPFGLWTLGAALLILLMSLIPHRFGIVADFIVAVLAGSLFLGAATAFGRISTAGYPSAFVFFFFLAWGTTIAIGTWKVDTTSNRLTLATLLGPRAALATAGILFFIFGIITTWPFLNGFYKSVYFWVIVIGVDIPLLWLWGRIRGRDKQLSDFALARFNRWIRWLTFVFLIALLLA